MHLAPLRHSDHFDNQYLILDRINNAVIADADAVCVVVTGQLLDALGPGLIREAIDDRRDAALHFLGQHRDFLDRRFTDADGEPLCGPGGSEGIGGIGGVGLGSI